MPCVTYISEYEEWKMKEAIKEHKLVAELLAEVNALTTQEWLCEPHKAVVQVRLFRAPIEEWRFTLYIDCHGEWQVFNFKDGFSGTENTVLAFLMGYRNGLAEAAGKTAKEIVA